MNTMYGAGGLLKWDAGPCTERLPVRFLVRAHAEDVGLIWVVGVQEAANRYYTLTQMFLSFLNK